MLPHPPGLIAFQPALFFQMTKASKVGSTQTQMDHPWAHELARRAPSHSSQCSKRLIQSIDRNADLLTISEHPLYGTSARVARTLKAVYEGHPLPGAYEPLMRTPRCGMAGDNDAPNLNNCKKRNHAHYRLPTCIPPSYKTK